MDGVSEPPQDNGSGTVSLSPAPSLKMSSSNSVYGQRAPMTMILQV